MQEKRLASHAIDATQNNGRVRKTISCHLLLGAQKFPRHRYVVRARTSARFVFETNPGLAAIAPIASRLFSASSNVCRSSLLGFG